MGRRILVVVLLIAFTLGSMSGWALGRVETSSEDAIESVALDHVFLSGTPDKPFLGYFCNGGFMAYRLVGGPDDQIILNEDRYHASSAGFLVSVARSYSGYIATAMGGGVAARLSAGQIVKQLRTKSRARTAVYALAAGATGMFGGYQVAKWRGVSCSDPRVLKLVRDPALWNRSQDAIAVKLLKIVNRPADGSTSHNPWDWIGATNAASANPVPAELSLALARVEQRPLFRSMMRSIEQLRRVEDERKSFSAHVWEGLPILVFIALTMGMIVLFAVGPGSRVTSLRRRWKRAANGSEGDATPEAASFANRMAAFARRLLRPGPLP
ncbi:hypothetical protein ACETK8_20145 (plasmid) [Brevundimonas staleyi]|uniref:Uncharacterized protein n=1 Tax=Brevundimonas staleyi TaxID=74326 RepID=A0ABW0FMA8_9CAUL